MGIIGHFSQFLLCIYFQGDLQLGVVTDDKVHFSHTVQLSSENPTYRYLTLNTMLYKEGYVKLDIPITTDGHVYKVTTCTSILCCRNAFEILKITILSLMANGNQTERDP